MGIKDNRKSGGRCFGEAEGVIGEGDWGFDIWIYVCVCMTFSKNVFKPRARMN